MPTLNWLIQESNLNNIRLITGENHILQEIKSVNVLDNPDVLKWFKQNELVLTTGYCFKDNPTLQRQMIKDMCEIGCAALAIKTKRFFRQIPDAIIDEAKNLDFPIIELPYFYSFSEISQMIFQQIYKEQNLQVEREQHFLSNFMQQILNHEPISTSLQQIAHFFATPVLLIDINCSLIASAFPYKYKDINEDNLHSLTDFLSIQISKNAIDNFYKINEQNYSLQTFSLYNQAGYLCFLHKQNSSLLIPTSKFLQNIIQLLTFACVQNQTLNTSYNNNSTFFLHFLVHHKQNNIEEIKKLCSFYGFDYRKEWICLTISLQNIPEKTKSSFLSKLNKFMKYTSFEDCNIFTCFNNNLFCIYFLFPANYHRLQALHQVQNFALILQTNFNEPPIFIGISACHKKITNISRAFEESLKALQYQQQINDFQPGSYLYQIPLHLLNQSSSNLLIHNILQPLLDFDQQNNTELIHTLKIYFSCNYNASQAAKILYLHRNTMLNRLEKIKEILQTDFNNSDENILIYLSLSALNL